MRRLLFSFSTLLLAGVAGCFLNHDGPTREPPRADIDVSIAGVSLGEECGESRLAPGACADEGPPAEEEPGLADCDGPCCGSFCQQSSVTLAIAADGVDGPLAFRVRSVTLLDSSGESLATLRADTPRIWAEDGYVAWDEQVGTPSEQQVLYDLHDLDWNLIPDSYSRTYRVRVVVEIAGEVRTLTSEETTREAPIVT
jgi:hypothetical protein